MGTPQPTSESASAEPDSHFFKPNTIIANPDGTLLTVSKDSGAAGVWFLNAVGDTVVLLRENIGVRHPQPQSASIPPAD